MQTANMHSLAELNQQVCDVEGEVEESRFGALEGHRNRSSQKLKPIRVVPTYAQTSKDKGKTQNDKGQIDSHLNSANQSQYQQPPTVDQPTATTSSATHFNHPQTQSQPSNSASQAIPKGKSEMMPDSKLKQSEISSPSRLNKKIKVGYQMANYVKAVEYQHTQSYRTKTPEVDGHDEYEYMSIWGSNQQLKEFGLGVYLFFEFLKRLTITLVMMSAVVILPLVESYNGTGMGTYLTSPSFATTLAKFSLGHIQNGDEQSYLAITVCDIVSMLILLIFCGHWRSFHKSIVEEMEKDHSIVNPVNYVVTVQNIADQTTNTHSLQADLKNYIDSLYQGSYQVEIVYNYLGNFNKFLDYDQQLQAVEREHQIAKQTGRNQEKVCKEEEKLDQLGGQIVAVSQAFEPMYAFVHFRTLKAKMAFLNHCKKYKLQNTWEQAFQRAICCVALPPQNLLFHGRLPLMLRNAKLSRPEQVNWKNMDISKLGSFVRWVLSFLFVIVAILITSSLIGLCTLYVSSTSSCENYNPPTGTIANQILAIQGSVNTTMSVEAATYCFCNANIASIYTDAAVNAFCGAVSNKVLVTNALQISASVVSSVSNIILGIIIVAIAKNLLRPSSIPKEYSFIFWGTLISNFINAAIIPLLLNGRILGVQFVSYLSFIDFINYSNVSLFEDFNPDWYALISPYYINFLIIGCFVSPFIGLLVFAIKNCIKHWSVKSKCEDSDREDPLIQKQANKKITGLQFSYAQESSNVILLLFIGILYSGLLPLTIPILTVGMFWIFVCKKTILLKYSIKVAADETLNESIINILPFIILAHGLFSIWSHTTPNIFQSNVQTFSLNLTVFSNKVDRIFEDALMLAEPVLVAVIIIIDYTLVSFFEGLASCCKDEFQMPVQWAAVENIQFGARIQKVNILGSYKLANNPTYGHAIKAYKDLAAKGRKEEFQVTKDNLNPEFA